MKLIKHSLFPIVLLIALAGISTFFLLEIQAIKKRNRGQDLLIWSTQKQIPSLAKYTLLVKELNEASQNKMTAYEVTEVARVIVSYCAMYEDIGLTSDVVMAVMERESAFNPKALSKAHARGLMQVIQTTFELHLQGLGYGAYSHDLAFNPVINTEVGIRHLVYLRKYWLSEGKDDWLYPIMSYFWGVRNTWELLNTKGRSSLPSLEYADGVLELAKKWQTRGVS